jgi:hypothetical protein
MKQINKKAQISALSPSVIAIVVAVIMLVLGVIIIADMLAMDIVTESRSGSATKQSVGAVSDAPRGTNLSVINYPCVKCSIQNIYNNTGVELSSTNWTTAYDGCNLRSVGAGIFNGTSWNATYTYTYGDTACTSGKSSLTGVASFADFIPLIVLAVVAMIIIGLILQAFLFRRQR